MSHYLDLDDVHTPTNGELVPVAWGHGIRTDFDCLVRPPTFMGACDSSTLYNVVPTATANDDISSAIEIQWRAITQHTGEFFEASNIYPTTFVVPESGLYFIQCKAIFDYQVSFGYLNSTARSWIAAVVADDNDEDTQADNYVLKQSADISVGHFLIGGIVPLELGQTLRFMAWQNTWDGTGGSGVQDSATALLSGTCAIVYLGGV